MLEVLDGAGGHRRAAARPGAAIAQTDAVAQVLHLADEPTAPADVPTS